MSADTLSLAGKTALVTGSGRETGIGAAIARAFARNGASVAIHYVSEGSKARAEKVATDINKEFGTKTTVVQGGVENYDTAKNMVEQILEAFGVDHIDILVNNAAAASNTSLLEVKEEQLEYEFAVNVFGVIYMTQAVVGVGRMPQGGRIVNIGSIASKILVPPPVYGAAKAAMDALTTFWAGELGKSHGITVNTLAPGPVPTDMSAAYLVAPDGSPTALQLSMYEQTRAANRLGSVEDVADATLLLVSEKSRWITAQFISVSGGITGTM
ncbi:short-chain dehydrogenase [Penicillium frequentans]|uniref:Short-chain dehydrogenase n=1 Tax=Penicillium frequentans TaxID=3151616 RepID=A0AAD6D024_9EURO|nr:short-chain dehydrogenase [Penicillium glabrum]